MCISLVPIEGMNLTLANGWPYCNIDMVVSRDRAAAPDPTSVLHATA